MIRLTNGFRGGLCSDKHAQLISLTYISQELYVTHLPGVSSRMGKSTLTVFMLGSQIPWLIVGLGVRRWEIGRPMTSYDGCSYVSTHHVECQPPAIKSTVVDWLGDLFTNPGLAVQYRHFGLNRHSSNQRPTAAVLSVAVDQQGQFQQFGSLQRWK